MLRRSCVQARAFLGAAKVTHKTPSTRIQRMAAFKGKAGTPVGNQL